MQIMAKPHPEPADPLDRVAGILLAGGASERLGQDKALLEVDGISLIERVTHRLATVVDEIVVVTDRPQQFAFLGLAMTRDHYRGVGVLGGLHAGLSTIRSDYGILVGCDMPFLNPHLLRYLASLRHDYDVVMPRLGDYTEPLHAVYSRRCLPGIQHTIEAGQRRIMRALDGVRVRYVEQAEMEPYDPDMLSFFNVNGPQDLEQMRALLSTRDRLSDRR